MMNWIKKLYYNEIMRYIFIGGCTTLVNLIAFAIFCKVLHFNQTTMQTTISNVVSIIIAMIFAYVTNKLFVFQSKTESNMELFIEFVKFISARLFSMVVEVGGVLLTVNIIGQDDMVGKLETQVVVVIINYVLSKVFIFTEKKDNAVEN